MFNLHLQAAEQELVKIISLDSHLQVTLGRRPASECSRQNGFFPQEDNPSISREHAMLKIDANQRVGGYSTPQSKRAYSRHSQLFIADAGSKLGTFINGKRISSKNKVSPFIKLKTGDFLVRDHSPVLASRRVRLNDW